MIHILAFYFIYECLLFFLFIAMVLQESDMFMDALTASTKSKEPRKRKRRTSITKDGPTEAKKQETASNDNRDVTPPPTSPSSADEKSPVVVKPNFKVYIITKFHRR